MRLAYITRAFPFAHLGETFLAPEIRRLSQQCAELHVIPVRPQLPLSVMEAGAANTSFVRMRTLDGRVLSAAASEALRNPRRAALALFLVLWPRYRFSAKLKNLAVFPVALAIARYVRLHRIEHIHAHWMTTPGTAAYIAACISRIPWSCTAHAHDIFSGNLLRQKVRSAAFVRAIAVRNRRHLAECTGIEEETIRLIRVGVEIPVAAAAPAPVRPLQIVCSARLDPIKGHEYLLHALALLRDRGLAVRCDMVGNGPEERRLQVLASRLHLDGIVTFRGKVEHRALLRELGDGRYDALVIASVEFSGGGRHEGIPVALIEAMAFGIPCVATQTGCIPELIDESTGIPVPERNPAAIADAFELLANRPEVRRRLGDAARARVCAQYDVAETARDLYALICGSADQRFEHADRERELHGGEKQERREGHTPRLVGPPAAID